MRPISRSAAARLFCRVMPREREDEDEDYGERKDLLSDWITGRNNCPEERIYR
jgi:hypothetical protein